jgi:hypothetical protein
MVPALKKNALGKRGDGVGDRVEQCSHKLRDAAELRFAESLSTFADDVLGSSICCENIGIEQHNGFQFSRSQGLSHWQCTKIEFWTDV